VGEHDNEAVKSLDAAGRPAILFLSTPRHALRTRRHVGIGRNRALALPGPRKKRSRAVHDRCERITVLVIPAMARVEVRIESLLK
jgi:hypothetical protein